MEKRSSNSDGEAAIDLPIVCLIPFKRCVCFPSIITACDVRQIARLGFVGLHDLVTERKAWVVEGCLGEENFLGSLCCKDGLLKEGPLGDGGCSVGFGLGGPLRGDPIDEPRMVRTKDTLVDRWVMGRMTSLCIVKAGGCQG